MCCVQPLCLESYRRSQPVAGRRCTLVCGSVGKGTLKVTQACSFIITTDFFDGSSCCSHPSTRWDPFQHRVHPSGLNPGGTGREWDLSTKLGCRQVPRAWSRGINSSFSCKTVWGRQNGAIDGQRPCRWKSSGQVGDITVYPHGEGRNISSFSSDTLLSTQRAGANESEPWFVTHSFVGSW